MEGQDFGGGAEPELGQSQASWEDEQSRGAAEPVGMPFQKPAMDPGKRGAAAPTPPGKAIIIYGSECDGGGGLSQI